MFINKKKSNYDELLSHVDIKPSTIVEVGIKDGNDTLIVSKKFKKSKYFAYEANPLMKKTIESNLRPQNVWVRLYNHLFLNCV